MMDAELRRMHLETEYFKSEYTLSLKGKVVSMPKSHVMRAYRNHESKSSTQSVPRY